MVARAGMTRKNAPPPLLITPAILIHQQRAAVRPQRTSRELRCADSAPRALRRCDWLTCLALALTACQTERRDGCQDGDRQKDDPGPAVHHSDYHDPPAQRRGEATEDDQHRSRTWTSWKQRFEIATHGRSPGLNPFTSLFIRARIRTLYEGSTRHGSTNPTRARVSAAAILRSSILAALSPQTTRSARSAGGPPKRFPPSSRPNGVHGRV